MKTLLVINSHSFVDLITNSSSELFICNTDKTIKMVKDLIKELIETYYRMIPNRYSFSECFGDIKKSKYTFDLDKFDRTVVEKYKLYEDCDSYRGSDSIKPQSYIDSLSNIENLKQSHPYYVKITSHSEKEDLWYDYLKKEDELWTPFGVEKLKSEMDLFVEFLKFNDIDDDGLLEEVKKITNESVQKHIENKSGKYLSVYFPENSSKKLIDAWDFFREMESWNIKINKGNIMIYSLGDNTVPYELFELINSYLSARNYHLG